MRTVLADDADDVRSALRLLLEEEFGAEIVGEVDREEDLVAALVSGRPDLLVLDWELTVGRDSASVLRLRGVFPGVRIVALSGRLEAREAALAAGVDGFASKGDGPEHLVRVVRSVFQERQGGDEEDEG